MATLTCTNDRYTPTRDTFASVEEFQAMCLAMSGERADLTRQPLNGRWVNELGETVLVESEDADSSQEG